MRSFHLGLMLFALSVTPFATSSAQELGHPGSEPMTIHVTVSTRAGDPVEGLTKDDFTLSNNKHQQPITDLQALTGTTTGIVIVFDAINLGSTDVAAARQQLAQFFSLNPHLPQPTALGVLLNSGLQMQPGFTTNGNTLRAALDHYSLGPQELPPSTGVYGDEERLEFSVNMFKSLVAQLPKRGLKRIIWISPGWPVLGGPGVVLNPAQRNPVFADIVQISTELRRSHIVVDAVNPVGTSQDVGRTNFYETFLRAPRNPREIELGQLALQVIAVQSGGLVLNGSNDVASLIGKALAQTRSSYELTFTPAPGEHDNDYNELQLNVRRPGVAVHTTAGYYARPVYAEPQSSENSAKSH